MNSLQAMYVPSSDVLNLNPDLDSNLGSELFGLDSDSVVTCISAELLVILLWGSLR